MFNVFAGHRGKGRRIKCNAVGGNVQMQNSEEAEQLRKAGPSGRPTSPLSAMNSYAARHFQASGYLSTLGQSAKEETGVSVRSAPPATVQKSAEGRLSPRCLQDQMSKASVGEFEFVFGDERTRNPRQPRAQCNRDDGILHVCTCVNCWFTRGRVDPWFMVHFLFCKDKCHCS